ncbi:MAG: hypothetical protein EPN21_06645 [Methylococcaceae bacterium]|nr:MAG: hypothetical protein EPN21_06645 [Methylococcaceae bacterium]
MKSKNLFFPACFAAALLLTGKADAGVAKLQYQRAVQDAAVADAAEIADNLDAVTADNAALVWNEDKTLIKVITWKSRRSYENYLLPYTQTSSSEANVVWVTLAPRIQEFCRDYMRAHPHASRAALEHRLKQRLGLHPDWSYDVFVELWVSPDDIFRPCVDPSPADTSCDLNFGAELPQVKNIQDYHGFYQNLYYGSFRAAPGVPWTGLGYTYDWGNHRGEQGASEFILSPSSPYQIDAATPTAEYCAP